MKTIIQKLPTIYGEALNGSVYGQPNGSIARPPQNVAASITIAGNPKLTYTGVPQSGFSAYSITDMLFTIVAPSGFNSIDVIVKNSANAKVGEATLSEHASRDDITVIGLTSNKPSNGDTVYITVILNGSDGNPIATSNTLEATAVIE